MSANDTLMSITIVALIIHNIDTLVKETCLGVFVMRRKPKPKPPVGAEV